MTSKYDNGKKYKIKKRMAKPRLCVAAQMRSPHASLKQGKEGMKLTVERAPGNQREWPKKLIRVRVCRAQLCGDPTKLPSAWKARVGVNSLTACTAEWLGNVDSKCRELCRRINARNTAQQAIRRIL